MSPEVSWAKNPGQPLVSLVAQVLALSGPVAVRVGKVAAGTPMAEPLPSTRMVPLAGVGRVAGAAALSVGTWPDGTVRAKLSRSPALVPVLILAQMVSTPLTVPAATTVVLFQPVDPSWTGLVSWPPLPWKSHRLPLLATPIMLGWLVSESTPEPLGAPAQTSPGATIWVKEPQPVTAAG